MLGLLPVLGRSGWTTSARSGRRRGGGGADLHRPRRVRPPTDLEQKGTTCSRSGRAAPPWRAAPAPHPDREAAHLRPGAGGPPPGGPASRAFPRSHAGATERSRVPPVAGDDPGQGEVGDRVVGCLQGRRGALSAHPLREPHRRRAQRQPGRRAAAARPVPASHLRAAAEGHRRRGVSHAAVWHDGRAPRRHDAVRHPRLQGVLRGDGPRAAPHHARRDGLRRVLPAERVLGGAGAGGGLDRVQGLGAPRALRHPHRPAAALHPVPGRPDADVFDQPARRTLAALLQGGLPLLNALEVAGASIGNRAMAAAVSGRRIRSGKGEA